MRRVLFLDTSALMEGRGIRQTDWRAVVSAESNDEILLVVAPVVVEELDDLKQHPQPSKKHRARRASKEIQDLVDTGGQVRPGVRLKLAEDELDGNALKAKRLTWDRGDDRVLGCVYAFQGEGSPLGDSENVSLLPGASNSLPRNALVRPNEPDDGPAVVLVGVDNSFLNRAISRKFETVRLTEDYLRKDDPDPVEVENKRLKAELERINDTYPKLAIAFADGSREKDVIVNSDLADDFALPFLREHVRAKDEVFEQMRLRRGEILARASEEDLLFKEFVDKQAAAMEAAQRISPVEFLIRNDGHHPANDVRITISLAEEIEAVEPIVPFPEDHLQPRTYVYDKLLLAGMPLFANRRIRIDPPERQPDYGVLGPHFVRGARNFRYQIGHVGDLANIGLPAVNLLCSPTGARAVLNYEIVATSVPKRFTGELVINIVRQPRRVPPPLPDPE